MAVTQKSPWRHEVGLCGMRHTGGHWRVFLTFCTDKS